MTNLPIIDRLAIQAGLHSCLPVVLIADSLLSVLCGELMRLGESGFWLSMGAASPPWRHRGDSYSLSNGTTVDLSDYSIPELLLRSVCIHLLLPSKE